jgi:hypothetical protein
MAENLHRVLETVEGMGLPEGDYLRVANALRQAFNERADRREPRRFRCVSKVKIAFNKGGVEYSLQLVQQMRTENLVGQDAYETEYKFYKNTEYTYHIEKVPFQRVISAFLHLHKPACVYIETDIGRKMLTTHQKEKSMMEDFRRLSERLAHPRVTPEIREAFEDDLKDAINFTYDDFIHEIISRVPLSELPFPS